MPLKTQDLPETILYRSVVIISNPVSGSTSRKKLQKARNLLIAQGVDVETLFTSKGGEATELARDAVGKTPGLIIAAGGDGTFNEVLNGMAGTDVPMAILPLGTTNVLARELGIPRNVKGAVEAALRRAPRSVSLGKLTIGRHSRYFCMMAGVGYDASTVLRVKSSEKRAIGILAYILRGLGVLLSWNPETLEVKVNGHEYTCHTLVASNSRKYAASFVLDPRADIAEPLLHLVLLNGRKRLDILRLALGIVIGRHRRLRGVTCLTASKLEVRSASPVQVDGDYAGMTPAVISIIPDALRLVY